MVSNDSKLPNSARNAIKNAVENGGERRSRRRFLFEYFFADPPKKFGYLQKHRRSTEFKIYLYKREFEKIT